MVGEVARFQELEYGFNRVQLRAVGRQAQQRHAGRDFERLGAMPAGAVENHQRVAAFGNRRCDVQQVPVHLAGVGPIADVANRHAGLRKDGGEQVAVSVSVVPRDPRAGAAHSAQTRVSWRAWNAGRSWMGN